jgi:hypothetical protein
MRIQTQIKSGGFTLNHNQTQVRLVEGQAWNHNQTQVRTVEALQWNHNQTQVQGPDIENNHNQTLVRKAS